MDQIVLEPESKILGVRSCRQIPNFESRLHSPGRGLATPMGVRRNFSRGGQRRNFAYPFQVADDAMQINVHKTLYPLCPITLCLFVEPQVLIFCLKCFLNFG